jgi:hypothetical protein
LAPGYRRSRRLKFLVFVPNGGWVIHGLGPTELLIVFALPSDNA